MAEKIQENLRKQPKSASIYDLCSPSECVTSEEGRSKDTLECKKCNRIVHYICSKLPVYQIQLCLTYKSRAFVCQNCVVITPDLLERVNSCKTSTVSGFRKEIKACENIMKAQDVEITQLKSKDVNTMISEIKDSFETRMATIEKKMEDIIEKKEENRSQSYAAVASRQIEKNIENVLRREKQEERQIQSTACNLILHGVDESTEDSEESTKIYDEEYLNEKVLPKKLSLRNIKIEETQRIGKFSKEKEDEKRYRPIKVRFANEEDKNTVLRAITKGERLPFRVTEDLTKSERKTIKEWCMKAQEMNTSLKDANFKFKVRGSPRKKLYLKKIVNRTKSGS